MSRPQNEGAQGSLRIGYVIFVIAVLGSAALTFLPAGTSSTSLVVEATPGLQSPSPNTSYVSPNPGPGTTPSVPLQVTLLAALLSGLIGAMLTAWMQWYRDERQDRQRLIAALRVIRYELAINAAVIVRSKAPHSTVTLATDLQDEAYRAVQLTLAQQLNDRTLRRNLVAGHLLIERAKQGRGSAALLRTINDLERDIDRYLASAGEEA